MRAVLDVSAARHEFHFLAKTLNCYEIWQAIGSLGKVFTTRWLVQLRAIRYRIPVLQLALISSLA
jgi:lipid-A-disaccharide synthase-like uncharacterized protein